MSDRRPAIPSRILVVEDEVFVRMVALDMLEDAGLSVTEAPNADAALVLIEHAPESYEVLFTDIDMPGSMNGLALAERVHARWPHIRLVVTSGRVLPRQQEIPNDGRFLHKPYMQAELLGAVREAA